MTKQQRRRGVVPLPAGRTLDERQDREDAALADIEDRVARGALSPADADRELIELVLAERFAYLSPDALDTLRRIGLELIEQPEVEQSRFEYGPPARPDPAPTRGDDE